jgi:hypothetical protein
MPLNGENMEIWKNIQEYTYSVSNLGRVRNDKTGGILSIRLDRNGYNRVSLHKDKKQKNFLVHRLVAENFFDICGEQVNHKDGNKLNNNIDNLEWVSRSENQIHRYYILKKGIKSVSLIKNDVVYEFDSIVEASKVLGIDAGGISRVINGKRNIIKGYRKNNVIKCHH